MKYKKTQKAPIPMIVQQMKRRGGKVQGSLNLRLRVRLSPNEAKRRRRNQINGTRVFRKKRWSDSLFSGEHRLMSLQYLGMLSISLRFHCLSPDMFCTDVQSCETSTKHPRSARGNFIPILKITQDELPMEQGVYGECLLCPLYPLLVVIIDNQLSPHFAR